MPFCYEEAMFSRRFLIAFLLAGLPLLLLPIDFWDGRLLDYALTSGDLTGLRAWLTADRWGGYYHAAETLHGFLQATGLPYLPVAHSLQLLFLLGIAYETYRYALGMFRMEPSQARFAALLCLFFPAWHVLAASWLLSYLACVWLALIGYRLLSGAFAPLGMVLLLASLQLNSNFTFLIGLALADRALARGRGEAIRISDRLRWSGVIAGSVAAFLAVTFLLPRDTSMTSNEPFASPYPLFYIKALLHFAAWPLAVAVLALATPRRLKHELLAILILFTAIAAPYVTVLKAPELTDLSDWSMRHAMLLAMPLSVFAAFASGDRSLARLLCFIAFATPYLMAQHGHYERAQRELALIAELKLHDAPPPGFVSLRMDDMHEIAIRGYEVQWLLWRAYGTLSWVAEMNTDLADHSFVLEPDANSALADPAPERRTAMLMPETPALACHTDLSFKDGLLAGMDTRCNGFR